MLFPYVATAATALLGSYFTREGLASKWFTCITPPSMPPRIVFPIVWTILYILLALSYEAFAGSKAAPWYIANLILNVYWCYAYFYDQDVETAFWTILALVGIAGTIVFMTRDYVRLLPYLAWLLFATYLTVQSRTLAQDCSGLIN